MSFGSDTPPPVPDYAGLAQQQGTLDQRAVEQSTTANRPTINTPWGTQSWEMTPGAQTFDQAAYDRDVAAYENRLKEFQNIFGSDRTVGQVQADSGGKRTSALFNQYNPGSTPDRNSEVYTYDAPDQWAQTTTLNPELQSALDQQFQLQNRKSQLAGSLTERLYDSYSEPFSFGDIPALPGDTSQITTDTYNKLRSLSDPYTERENSALESSLANKGLTLGSEQWKTAMQQRGDELSRNDLQRQLTALREGRAEGESAINLRDAAIRSQLLERSVPLNEMNAILSGQQVSLPEFPDFTKATTAGASDVYGAAKDESDYLADIFNYGQQQNAQTTSAAAGLGGTALMAAALAFSDARLKHVHRRVGETATGTPLYEFNYLMDDRVHVGVLAQEAPPEAVHVGRSGYLVVDYGLV